MLYAFYCIVPIFALIAIGYITKFKFIHAHDFWGGVEKITYYLLFPALLINSLVSVDVSQNLSIVIIPLILATLLLGFLLIPLQRIFKIEHSAFTSYFQGTIRYNSYVFIGIASALYGTQALPIVSIIIAYMITLTNIMSVVILSVYAEKRIRIVAILKGIIKNPLVVSCLIGILLNRVSFLYPQIIYTLFNFLGAAALPMSLMAVGAGLKLEHVANKIKPIVLVNIGKLLILPLFSLFFLNLFSAPAGLAKNVALLYAAVPCAGNAYILARQMKGDHEVMASIISTTTLLSIITIPIIITFLG